MITSSEVLNSLSKIPSAPAATPRTDFSFIDAARPFSKSRNAGQTAMDALTMQRTQDYNSTFAPVAGGLRELALSQYDEGATLGEARLGGSSFDASIGAMGRERRGLGVGGASANETKRLGLRRMLAEIDAGNNKIARDDESRAMAQDYMAGAYGDNMAGAGAIYGDIAKRELDRKAQYQMAQANRSSGLMSLAGTAAGIAMAI